MFFVIQVGSGLEPVESSGDGIKEIEYDSSWMLRRGKIVVPLV